MPVEQVIYSGHTIGDFHGKEIPGEVGLFLFIGDLIMFFKTHFLKISFIWIFVFYAFTLFSQVKSIGTPNIRNFTKSDYNAGTQNWSICQSSKGFLYFANNDGVLQFDGLHWDLIGVPGTSPVRSVAVDSRDNIYVGLFDDFGFLKQNNAGQISFHSLRPLLPDNNIEFEDVWRIFETSHGTIFQSYEYLFVLKNGTVEVIKPHTRFHFSFLVNERLFLSESGEGLFEYIDGVIHEVPWAGELQDAEINTILEIRENQLLIGTRDDGIYKFENGRIEKWQTPANELVKAGRLFSAAIISDSYFVFGTILDGIVISDANGNIVQHLNRNRGLQNNTVLSLFADNNRNLWLGLDNGIDYVEINSPLSYFSDRAGLGTGYSCAIFQDNVYLGTNQGLFVKPVRDFLNNVRDFELIENTAGQIWSLEVFDDQLICGHNSGTFRVHGHEAVKIGSEEGGWKYIKAKSDTNYLIGGHYHGLVLLRKVNDKWTFYKRIKGFSESSRFLFQDEEGHLWISHGGKGIFRVQLNEAMDSVIHYRLFAAEDGLPTDEKNILFPLKNQLYVSTIDGIFQFEESADTFVRNVEVDQLFPINGQLLTIEQDDQGNVWFISDRESGVFRRNEDMNYTKITTPFKRLDGKYVNGFEFIYPWDNDQVFFGMDNGFAHYSSKVLKSYSEDFQSYITRLEMSSLDTTIFFCLSGHAPDIKVPFSKNEFRFHYTAPFYETLEQLRFSYFLDPFFEVWSDWSVDRYRDFTNLPEGDYTFMIKAKNIYGKVSETASLSFTILPPWYRSKWAYYGYVTLVFGLIFFVVRLVHFEMTKSKKRQKLKHDAELQKRDELFQHQALVAEKEIVTLRNDKLRDEMIYRDKELVNQTMGIIQKNRFLMHMNEELVHIHKVLNDSHGKGRISKLNRKIQKEIDNNQQNQLFETYFDEVHNEFFEKLKQHYPQLSPREMRLSAYIKMNLTSKEIAALLNISARGVEISRYRLRKKLNLPRETNLSTFLSNI